MNHLFDPTLPKSDLSLVWGLKTGIIQLAFYFFQMFFTSNWTHPASWPRFRTSWWPESFSLPESWPTTQELEDDCRRLLWVQQGSISWDNLVLNVLSSWEEFVVSTGICRKRFHTFNQQWFLSTGPQALHLRFLRLPDLLHDVDGFDGSKRPRCGHLHLTLPRLWRLRLGWILHQSSGHRSAGRMLVFAKKPITNLVRLRITIC